MKLKFFLLLFSLLGLSACSSITTNPVQYFKTDDAVDWRTGDFHVDGLEFRIMKRGETYLVNPAWVGNEEGWSPLISTEKGWVTNAVGQDGLIRIDFDDKSGPRLDFFKASDDPAQLKFRSVTTIRKLIRVPFKSRLPLTAKQISILEEAIIIHPDRTKVSLLKNSENWFADIKSFFGTDRLTTTLLLFSWQKSNVNFELNQKIAPGALHSWYVANYLVAHASLVRLRDITIERWNADASGEFSGIFRFSNYLVEGRCIFSGKGDKIELMSFARKGSDKLTDGYPIRGDNFGRKFRYNALNWLVQHSDYPKVASGEFYEAQPPGLYVVESSDYCDDAHLQEFSIKLMEHQKAHEAKSPRVLLVCKSNDLPKLREKLKPLCDAAGLPMWHLALTDGTGEDIKGIPVMVPD